MTLSLQVLSGERYGESLVLDKTTSVGRQGDLSFSDTKMSKIHAFFELRGHDWWIRDNESKNGLLVNNQSATEQLLREGDLVEIGVCQFRVGAISSSWKAELNQLLLLALESAQDAPLTARPFAPVLVLKFIQGVQVGESWTIEYGPRRAGGECTDLQLFEAKTPDIAFEIIPSKEGPVFKTKYPSVVLLNSQQEKKKALKKGDKISIYNTVIAVDFVSL